MSEINPIFKNILENFDKSYDMTLELKRISESKDPRLDQTQREFLVKSMTELSTTEDIVARYERLVKEMDDEKLLAEAEDRGVI